MASVSKDSKGYRIRFIDVEGVQRTIRMQKANKAACEEIGRHLDELVSAKTRNQSMARRTAAWLADTGASFYRRLEKLGLVEARESSSLGMFLKAYLKRRTDAKASTVRKWQSAVNHLIQHFGDDIDLRSINAGHADEFRSYLYGNGHAENTVRRYCGIAKQFFRAAQRKKLIDENPFADQVAAVKGNAAKFHFVSRSDTEKLLKASPDLQWRMIVSLARYGGLRCPSEILALRWEDIDWQNKRFTVCSSKTEHHEGKESRLVPLFPELVEVLNEGYETEFERLNAENPSQTAVVSGPVITRYRNSTQNLRTTFLKIIKRAGLAAWPKVFQNLRSTRETELADQFPLQAVTAWMGNSQLVASKHYLQLTDEHFERAVSGEVAYQVAYNSCKETRTEKPTKAKNPVKTNVLRGSADGFASVRDTGMGDEGLETLASNAGETSNSENGGLPGGLFASEYRNRVADHLNAALAVLDEWRESSCTDVDSAAVDRMRGELANLMQSPGWNEVMRSASQRVTE